MGSQTKVMGWPFPQSSDLIAEGAVNIEQLAEQVEPTVFLAYNKFTPGEVWTSYPAGQSLMKVYDAAWPAANGTVITYKPPAASYIQQWFMMASYGGNPGIYFRQGWSPSGEPQWSDWQTIAGPGTPNAMAAGRVTVTPTAGAPKAVSITLPSGRFKSESEGGLLLVQLSAGGATHPEDISLCTYSISPTTLVVYIWRKSATDTAISWQVTQGLVAAN